MTEQMKPSGIDWIGDIPQSWSLKRVKYVTEDIKDGTHGTYGRVDSGEMLLSAKNVFDDGLHISENESEISYEDYLEITSNGFPRKNDVLLCCVGTVGRCCVYTFDKPLAFQRSVSFLRPSKKTNSEYLKYLLQSDSTLIQEQLLINKSAQDGLYMGSVKELIIPYTIDLNEQKAIADFLDKQCGKIDSIISDLEKQIETLQKYKKSLILETVTKGLNKNVPMKSSGIDWIGDIPAHWDINKIKYLFSIVNGSTPESNDLNYWDGDISWITPADMEEFGEIAFGERNITTLGYDSCGTSLLPIGSIVISTRAPIGKINITTNVLCTNQGCKSLVGSKDNKYFYYLLYALKDQLTLLGRGTTFLELSTSALANFKIIIPKDEEQISIVNYLDSQCEKIDSILKDKQEQLEKLKQHKKSLIYEYVTGKKRVKEATNGN